MKKINMSGLLFILAAFAASISAQSGGTFTITQSVTANGGGASAGGTLTMTGTTGQTIAGTLSTGTAFNVHGGFWQSSSNASVSGRVLTFGGRGVRNATVNITDPQNVTRQVRTGSLGNYRFDNVLPGQTYTFTIVSRRFQFTTQMISVNDDLTGVNFIASQ